jgi:hypothetical protein
MTKAQIIKAIVSEFECSLNEVLKGSGFDIADNTEGEEFFSNYLSASCYYSHPINKLVDDCHKLIGQAQSKTNVRCQCCHEFTSPHFAECGNCKEPLAK